MSKHKRVGADFLNLATFHKKIKMAKPTSGGAHTEWIKGARVEVVQIIQGDFDNTTTTHSHISLRGHQQQKDESASLYQRLR